jgi:osmotically-inducible protein OsmY
MRRTSLSLAFACAVALGAAACSSTPDPSESAEKALKEANITEVEVDWDKDSRIAHLKGTVASPADRDRAEEVATSAVGTTGRVLNEVTIKGLNEHTADDLDGRIRSTLDEMVDEDAVLKERDIDFEVANGVVTVKGEVRTAAEKAKVTQLVRSAPGVKDFANALEIEPKK